MRHDTFIAFEMWNGKTVWVNPDAVVAVCERKEDPDEQDPTQSYLYTSDGSKTAFHLKDDAATVAKLVSHSRSEAAVEEGPDEDEEPEG